MNQPVNPPIPPEESLIQYPSDFPIKVMGAHDEAFVEAIVAIAQVHAPDFDPATGLQRRPSSNGNYLGLTITVRATSREQLDNLYRALTGHPLAKYVLWPCRGEPTPRTTPPIAPDTRARTKSTTVRAPKGSPCSFPTLTLKPPGRPTPPRAACSMSVSWCSCSWCCTSS